MTMALPLALTEPLADVPQWAARWRDAEIPVLQDTADALEGFRANEDNADANSLGEMIAGDPLMTLKVLAYESQHRSRRAVTPAETVTSALVMMGISPFFRAFGPQPTVKDRLATNPAALAGLRGVLQRAHRGANFALGFAIHRTDPDAATIHAVTLLHEFAEMLLWCHAPSLALRIRQAQEEDPALRSSIAQRDILNVELSDVQDALVGLWRLPPLLSDIRDPSASNQAAARTVELAARLARHTTHGWDNPALPDDVADIAALLNLSPAAALQFVQDV